VVLLSLHFVFVALGGLMAALRYLKRERKS
jgi:hypothetical protein